MEDFSLTSNQLIKQPSIAGMYCRVSTGRQEQEATVESQTSEVKARIKADGNILPEGNIFIDDGWTGELLQRPALDAMRDAALAGKFQILYVYDRGRLARKFAYQEIVIEELTDKSIQFVTMHDVNAVTPEEHVLQAMQGVFHEYERIKIAERMRRGKLYKARSGVLINGGALYGFTYVRKSDKTPAHYEINEEETRIVKMIFSWFVVERLSIRQIIKKLYELGIPPRKQKREFWTKGPIVRILKQEAYFTGTIYYNKSEAVVAKKPLKNDKYKKVKRTSRRVRAKEEWIPYKVPAIMEDYDLFIRAQEFLDYNKKYASKNRKHDYLLTSKTFCECGSRRIGDGYGKDNNHYYRCAERIYKFPLEGKCRAHGVNATLLDGFFWQHLVKYLTDEKLLKKSAEKWLETESLSMGVDENEKRRLVNELTKLKEEELRYAKVYGEGTLDQNQFRELMKEAKRKELLYQSHLNSLSKKTSEDKIEKSDIDELYKETREIIKKMDFGNKTEVVRDIIDKVILYDNGRVEVNGHFPVNLNMGYEPISRDCGTSKCGQVNAF